ncbi:copper resistance protein CopC/CopD [Synechococcus sp. H60.1]|uniref:copper resistance CopC/CopD family protein n=1 Tax=Synechococcus sp. H60.1 TaxID=2964517 RepID=UPI0039C0D467
MLWVGGIQPVFAHASLLSTFPEDGAILQEGPAQVRLVFNEPVQLTQLQVLDGNGQVLPLENLVGTGNAPQGDLPAEIPEGVYIVSWRAISADSHPVSGSFAFQVGTADPGLLQAARAAQAGDPFYWPLVGVRWGIYLGSLFVVGVLGWWRLVRGRSGPADQIELSAEAWAFAAAWLTLSLTLVALSLHLAQLYPHFAGSELLSVLASPYGWGTGLRLVGLGILIWACEGGPGWANGLGSMAVIGSFLPIGHALTSEYPAGTMALLGLHLAGSAFWLGGLWGLERLLSHSRQRDGVLELTPPAVGLIQRFSDVATWAVPGLVLAGVGMGGIHRGWDWDHPYGQYLWAKLLLVLMILGLAAHNKLRLLPALRSGVWAAARSLQGIVRLELVGLVLVLALTSFLVAQAPPGQGAELPREPACQATLGWPEGSLRLQIRPCRPGNNKVQVEVKGIPAQELSLDFDLPARGIPPLRRQALPKEPGRFEVEDVLLPLAGEWQIRVRLLVSDFEERREQVRLRVGDR